MTNGITNVGGGASPSLHGNTLAYYSDGSLYYTKPYIALTNPCSITNNTKLRLGMLYYPSDSARSKSWEAFLFQIGDGLEWDTTTDTALPTLKLS